MVLGQLPWKKIAPPTPELTLTRGQFSLLSPTMYSYMEPVLELYKGLLGDWQVCSVE